MFCWVAFLKEVLNSFAVIARMIFRLQKNALVFLQHTRQIISPWLSAWARKALWNRTLHWSDTLDTGFYLSQIGTGWKTTVVILLIYMK